MINAVLSFAFLPFTPVSMFSIRNFKRKKKERETKEGKKTEKKRLHFGEKSLVVSFEACYIISEYVRITTFFLKKIK